MVFAVCSQVVTTNPLVTDLTLYYWLTYVFVRMFRVVIGSVKGSCNFYLSDMSPSLFCCSDNLFPALGFGARLPPNGIVSHEFALVRVVLLYFCLKHPLLLTYVW